MKNSDFTSGKKIQSEIRYNILTLMKRDLLIGIKLMRNYFHVTNTLLIFNQNNFCPKAYFRVNAELQKQ